MNPSNRPHQSSRISRVLRVAGIAVFVIVVFSYIDVSTRILAYVEQQTYGDRLEVDGLCFPKLNAEAEHQVAVVAISDSTYSWASNGGSVQAFLPRADYAKLVDRLTVCGAKVIAFDLLFDTRQPDDTLFASSIKNSGRVVLACGDQGDTEITTVYPEPIFLAAGAKIGHTRVPVSVDRPAIDDIEPSISTPAGMLPALSVEAVNLAKPAAALHIVTDYSDTRPAFKIRYLYSPSGVFVEVPLEAILSDSPEQRAFFEHGDVFRNKIVLIGDTTKIHGDRHLTPLDTMPGVLIQANAVATLLNGHYLHEASPAEEIILIFVLVATTTVISSVWPLRRMAVLVVLILPVYFLLNICVFVLTDNYWHLAAPSLAILITAVFVLLERALTEESEKARIRALLRRYVNPKIANYIMAHPELIGSAGNLVTGTVLFTDLRGFTKMTEELDATMLVSRLNEYFETITDVVFRHDGTAVTIVGDAMLAVFGIPVPTSNHADLAVAAALEIQTAVKLLQQKWNGVSGHNFETGAGINTGEVIVGEVGGKQLRNFSVYGLQVNLASRIEEKNKELGTDILMTRATYDALTSPITVRGPFLATVDGVEAPIELFEVQGTIPT